MVPRAEHPEPEERHPVTGAPPEISRSDSPAPLGETAPDCAGDLHGRSGGDGDTDRSGPLHRTAHPRHWWLATRIGISIALSRIVAGVLVGHAATVLFPQAVIHSSLSTLSNGTWLGAFDRWDARYYTAIASHGYPSHHPDFRAFFPGYPLVVRAVHQAIGGSLGIVQTASLVSMAAFTLAAGLLFRLVHLRFNRRVALITTALFCWFPTSVFFLAPYSEALFSLEILVVATLIDKGRWWWAALVAGYASATSPESVALTAALVVASLVARRGLVRSIGYGVIASSGMVGFMIYLGFRFGRPLAFADVEPAFHRVLLVPLVGLVENIGAIEHVLVHRGPTIAGIHNLSAAALWNNVAWMWIVDDTAVVLAVFALTSLVVTALRDHHDAARLEVAPRLPILWILVLAGITLTATATVVRAPGGPISTEAAARLVSVAFPLPLGLALLCRRRMTPAMVGLALFVCAALVTQTLFNLGYWVT